MTVLIVARCKDGRYAPFITEQVEALERQGVECRFLGIRQKGIWGYFRQLPVFWRDIFRYHPDIIHAHYGLCGVLANLQKRIPVVTTYHGSDINSPRVLRLSRIAIRRSRFNIFVSRGNVDIAKPQGEYALIPCGINLDDYPTIEQAEARRIMGLDPSLKYVLFSGSFDNYVKNAPLAQEVIRLIPQATLVELKGYSRSQVAILMQAVDALLMTSFMEGSPQVIKEAMACGCPIVSVDVGDVKERIEGIPGCYVVSRDVDSIARKVREAIYFHGKTPGREVIKSMGLSNDYIASQIIAIYNSLV